MNFKLTHHIAMNGTRYEWYITRSSTVRATVPYHGQHTQGVVLQLCGLQCAPALAQQTLGAQVFRSSEADSASRSGFSQAASFTETRSGFRTPGIAAARRTELCCTAIVPE